MYVTVSRWPPLRVGKNVNRCDYVGQIKVQLFATIESISDNTGSYPFLELSLELYPFLSQFGTLTKSTAASESEIPTCIFCFEFLPDPGQNLHNYVVLNACPR